MKAKLSRFRGSVLVLLGVHCWGAITIQPSVTPSQPSPVGTIVKWNTTATDTNPGVLEYRYETRGPGSVFAVVRDFHPSGAHDWAPSFREGRFDIRITVRNRSTGQAAQTAQSYYVSSRVTGSNPTVTATENPLVALYSSPGCSSGQDIRVRFRAVGSISWEYTNWRPCTLAFSYNIYVAGMLPNTTYVIQHEINNGQQSIYGEFRTFTTGGLPADIQFPLYGVPQPATIASSYVDNIILHGHLTPVIEDISVPVATDISGLIRWFYPKLASSAQFGSFVTRPIAGGGLLLIVNDEFPGAAVTKNQILREIDLAGNTVRETNTTRVSDQLITLGKPAITSFHHEAFRMANGHTILLASLERILVDVQGPGPVNVVGDAIVDLDENMKVVWFWDGFDHLDQTKRPVLGEVCQVGSPGCPPLVNGPTAVDWTHSNSVSYVPSDGSLIMSIRHFDWVVKINYANGTGDGSILWRLGEGGDFAIQSNDPNPWFSHQHDAEFEVNGALTLYDNGNTRRTVDPNANSRGQVYILNESTKTAALVVNGDLGVYSVAVGSAERLTNGNYYFCSGFLSGTSSNREIRPLTGPIYEQTASRATYRSFRMQSLHIP